MPKMEFQFKARRKWPGFMVDDIDSSLRSGIEPYQAGSSGSCQAASTLLARLLEAPAGEATGGYAGRTFD